MRRAKKEGIAVLVGAGPGNAGLITVEGENWLARADAIVYDRLAGQELLAKCRHDAELIYVGKSPAGHTLTQEKINALLVDLVQQGKLVIRLKGGDPLIFGRGGEEAMALQKAGCKFRIVPGVTAAIAAGAMAGIPLTHRTIASTVAFITGHEDPTKEESAINFTALSGIDTLVFYMGVRTLGQIAEQLISHGKPPETPAAIVENASSANQRCIRGTLGEIAAIAAANNIQPPALTIIGKVVELSTMLDWRSTLPLAGKTIIVTRSRTQASELSNKLTALGANVIQAPTIQIEPVENFVEMDSVIGELAEKSAAIWDWIAFTSPNGVEHFFDRMLALGVDARKLGATKLAAIGQATSDALAGKSLIADIVPGEFTSAGLAAAMTKTNIAGKKVLLPRANIATDALADELRRAGAEVIELTVYRNVTPGSLPRQARDAIAKNSVDWITFTSSSTAENFVKLIDGTQKIPSTTATAAIGPVTAQTMQKLGITPTVVAGQSSVDSLADAIVEFEISRYNRKS